MKKVFYFSFRILSAAFVSSLISFALFANFGAFVFFSVLFGIAFAFLFGVFND